LAARVRRNGKKKKKKENPKICSEGREEGGGGKETNFAVAAAVQRKREERERERREEIKEEASGASRSLTSIHPVRGHDKGENQGELGHHFFFTRAKGRKGERGRGGISETPLKRSTASFLSAEKKRKKRIGKQTGSGRRDFPFPFIPCGIREREGRRGKERRGEEKERKERRREWRDHHSIISLNSKLSPRKDQREKERKKKKKKGRRGREEGETFRDVNDDFFAGDQPKGKIGGKKRKGDADKKHS